MDDHIPPHLEIGSDGGENAEHILVKASVKIADNIIRAGILGGIKPLDDAGMFQVHRIVRIQDHEPGRVDDPDGRIQVYRQGIQLGLNGFQGGLIIVQIGSIGVGDQSGFLVQRIRLFSFHMFQSHAGAKGGDHQETEKAENQIGEQELQIEGFPHCLTSNL